MWSLHLLSDITIISRTTVPISCSRNGGNIRRITCAGTIYRGLIVAEASFTPGEQILESFSSCLHLLTAGITPACITAPEEQTQLSVRNEHATSQALAGSGDRRFRPFRKPFKHLLVPMVIPLARLLTPLPTTPLGEESLPLAC